MTQDLSDLAALSGLILEEIFLTVFSYIQTLVIVHDSVAVLPQALHVSAVNKVSTDALYVIASLMPALLCQSQKVAVIPQ